MLWRVLLLTAFVAASGCVGQSTETRRDQSQQCLGDACTTQDREMTCVEGECEVCVDDACAECERDDCERCFEQDECPTLTPDGEADAQRLEDVDIQETHDLSQGLASTTWTFQVARGATGHAYWIMHDLATRSYALSADLCVEWSFEGPSASANGNQGSCGTGFAAVSGTTMDKPLYVVDWERLDEGTYTVTASGPPQLNELVVDVVVDNP